MPCPEDAASHRAYMPEGSSAILNARSLKASNRRLAEMLRSGLTVLDVGCGTGAITRGIAEAVVPNGRVVGIDANTRLIGEARRTHGDVPGLSFEVCDLYRLAYHDRFDVVTAARVLQWLANPLEALRKMAAAVKPGGMVLVLDFNHEKICWQPSPPPSMQTFYSVFLRWRADAGMDNAIADHLAAMFTTVGLAGIVETPQHEASRRGDPGFESHLGIWGEVAASRGHQMVADGMLTETERAAAEADYRVWIRDSAESQILYLITVEGVRPIV
jgi:2-polyprenyl-3-methyl-5-hydroxy-6-metoxy-1,4-benzoquinol methylase